MPRPLLIRPNVRYACAGDGICCTTAHALGPVTPREATRLRRVASEAVRPNTQLQMLEIRPRSGSCIFRDDGCSIHRSHGEPYKPLTCRRFPFGVVGTDMGARVTTEHRCPCRTMGARPLVTDEVARRALGDAALRVRVDVEAPSRIALTRDRRVGFARYAEEESQLLALLHAGEIDAALDAPARPWLDGATWTDVAHRYRGHLDGTACGQALAWFGDALFDLEGGSLPATRARLWSASFDRAEARSPAGAGGEAILADWLADEVWNLRWIERGTFEAARRDLATRIEVARWITGRLGASGVRDDRAAAEAVLVVELAGLLPLWGSVVASMSC